MLHDQHHCVQGACARGLIESHWIRYVHYYIQHVSNFGIIYLAVNSEFRYDIKSLIHEQTSIKLLCVRGRVIHMIRLNFIHRIVRKHNTVDFLTYGFFPCIVVNDIFIIL